MNRSGRESFIAPKYQTIKCSDYKNYMIFINFLQQQLHPQRFLMKFSTVSWLYIYISILWPNPICNLSDLTSDTYFTPCQGYLSPFLLDKQRPDRIDYYRVSQELYFFKGTLPSRQWTGFYVGIFYRNINRLFRSVVFNSGQKMSLRSLYFINVHRACGQITT